MNELKRVVEMAECSRGRARKPTVDELHEAVKRYTGLERAALHATVALRWPRISLEFLRLRDRDGWPRFAVFNLVEPMSFMRRGFHWHLETNDGWPPGVLDDMDRRLRLAARKQMNWFTFYAVADWSVRISQRFSGMVPDEAMQEARWAKEVLGKRKFTPAVIAEAGPWELNVVRNLPAGDPLLVAVSTSEASGFLLHHWDLTDAEDYVRREFTND